MTERRRLRPEEARLWAVVARTVAPARGRSLPEPPPEPAPAAAAARPTLRPAGALFTRRAPNPLPGAAALPPRAGRPSSSDPEGIEPNRRRRIARAPEAIAARLDLHGLDQDRAKAALFAFLRAAHRNDARAVLVITGKGPGGAGVLKTRAPEWLADPEVRPLIAGVSQAERRHGGAGALYVALKRRA